MHSRDGDLETFTVLGARLKSDEIPASTECGGQRSAEKMLNPMMPEDLPVTRIPRQSWKSWPESFGFTQVSRRARMYFRERAARCCLDRTLVPTLSMIVRCVCVFSSHPFWTSSTLDVPAGVTQEEGHTGFLIHLPSAVRALIFVARRIQPFLSLVDREVEFCVLTN